MEPTATAAIGMTSLTNANEAAARESTDMTRSVVDRSE